MSKPDYQRSIIFTGEDRCRICRSNTTRETSNGEKLWIRDKDISNKYTKQIICYDCAFIKNISCCECGNDKSKGFTKCYDKHGYWTGKRVCYDCRNKTSKDYRNSSHFYIKKSNADCRNKNLDPDSSAGKGYITEVLVAKFLGIKTCFEITGNFNHKAFDIYEHEDWGRINVKGSSLLYDCDGHLTWFFNKKKSVIPDFFFCIGYDKDMKNVESVHIIPNGDDVCNLTYLFIPKDICSKWYIFKESEEGIKKWNELFHTLKLEDCPVLRQRQ